jgi:hypothetical protein
MENHVLFIGNVSAHLVTLMSGIASFGIAVWQAYKKNPISEKVFWVIGVICLLVAVDSAWQDEHRNTRVVIAEKAVEVGTKNSCIEDARVDHAYLVGLQGLNTSERETIDRQQQANDAQQRDVSSCVVSLGKMNPMVREKISVFSIPVATKDAASNRLVGMFTPHKVYLAELVITKNETQPRPNGAL